MTRLWPEGEPVAVWGSEAVGLSCANQTQGDRPAGFVWQGVSHPVLDVCNRWRIHTRWWEPGETIWREYLKVTTDTGLLCLLYRDLISGGWFLARVYD
jgi:hypothetical protein